SLDYNGLSGRQHDNRNIEGRKELVGRKFCARTGGKAVVVHQQNAPVDDAIKKEADRVPSRLVQIYVDMDKAEPPVRNLVKSSRDPALVNAIIGEPRQILADLALGSTQPASTPVRAVDRPRVGKSLEGIEQMHRLSVS